MRKICSVLALLLSITAWAQLEVVNVENPAVRFYMSDQTYEIDNDFGTSIVTDYKDEDLYGENLDWPAGKLVQWTSATQRDQVKEIRITVSEHENYTDSVTHNPESMEATSYVIRNMIPGRTYFYKVEEIGKNGSTRLLTDGAFKTEGQVRMIQVKGAHNIRDIGGWPTSYGVPIKYGMLYRSASLDGTNRYGIHDFVENLNMRAELDLRSEAKLEASKLGEEVDYTRTPSLSYNKALTEKTGMLVMNLRWIIDRMREGKSVDWHCAIGCDRCGTLSFLIEGLLGVGEVDLGRDYELSTFAFDKIVRQRKHVKPMVNIIKQYGPADNLAECFYNYWVEIGMLKRDLNYFINKMLGVKVKRTTTKRQE